MRILYVNLRRILKNTTAGGELHVVDLIRGCEGRDIDAYVFYPHGGRLYVFDWRNNKEHEYVGSSLEDIFGNNVVEDKFRKIITDFSIDIVHFQNFQTLPLSLIRIAKEEGKRIVMTIHDYFLWCDNYTLLSPVYDENRLSFCFFERQAEICSMCLNALAFQPNSSDYVIERRKHVDDLIGMVDKFIFPAEYPKSIFLSLYGNMGADKCEVIEHGINRMLIQNSENGRCDSGSFNIAFLGAFRKAKGSDAFLSLIEAFKHRKDIRFTIFGRMEENIGLASENLYLFGEYNRNSIFSLLREHCIDILLLLSPWPETYSYTLTEAVIAGIPVISTDIGALRERISKHFAGWLVPYENPVPRTVDIINSLAKEKETVAFLKNSIRESSRKIPSVVEMSEKYVELYDRLK